MAGVIITAAIVLCLTTIAAFAVVCIGIRCDDLTKPRPGLPARLARRLTGMRPLPPFDQVSVARRRRPAKTRRDQRARCGLRAGRAVAEPAVVRSARHGARP